MTCLLKHRGRLPVGHGLWTGMQWRAATVKKRTLERIVVQDLLSILEFREPHTHVLKVDARCNSLWVILGCARVAGSHREGHERNNVKDRFAAAISPRRQVRYILNVAEGLAGKLDQEDGERRVGRHLLYIDSHRIGGAVVAVPAHDCHQTRRIREPGLDARSEEHTS